MAKPRVVNCPQCARPVEWTEASPFRPFCSERCKIIDLGAWAAEAYRVPAAEPSDPDDVAEKSDDPLRDADRRDPR